MVNKDWGTSIHHQIAAPHLGVVEPPQDLEFAVRFIAHRTGQILRGKKGAAAQIGEVHHIQPSGGTIALWRQWIVGLRSRTRIHGGVM